MFGNFIMKTLMKQQMKDLPEDVKGKMLSALDSNPDFFKNILSEITAKVQAGQSQISATQQVMLSHRNELQKMLGQ